MFFCDACVGSHTQALRQPSFNPLQRLENMNDIHSNPLTHPLLQRMGGLVATQVECALNAIARTTKGDVALALRREDQINALERGILRECETSSSSLVLRPLHPSQRISLARAAKDLERIGDEAKKIIGKCLIVHGEQFFALEQTPPIVCMAHHACQGIVRAIGVLDTLDKTDALRIIDADLQIDAELEEVMSQVVEIIHTTPLAARSGLDVVFIAKAWERIGDHAKNLAENALEVVVQSHGKGNKSLDTERLLWENDAEVSGT